ncbi:hypothetical protein [uncultured Flavobacterium sp.]|uniref:hypothetical protein n=1 Tax=uncultured Flavobacterium sp. TaxID=165435 RepID=UPI0025F2653C|nr:hypothetical protein [uncultured Flavobacterium sp.]
MSVILSATEVDKIYDGIKYNVNRGFPIIDVKKSVGAGDVRRFTMIKDGEEIASMTADSSGRYTIEEIKGENAEAKVNKVVFYTLVEKYTGRNLEGEYSDVYGKSTD